MESIKWALLTCINIRYRKVTINLTILLFKFKQQQKSLPMITNFNSLTLGLSGQQAVDNLIKVLEQLGAKKKGNFLVDCETYYSAPTIEPARVLNIIHNSDQPATCYALLDTGTGTSIAVDNNFDILMLTMSALYQTKKSSKMECKGPRYELNDFVIKIGSVSIGPSFKGR